MAVMCRAQSLNCHLELPEASESVRGLGYGCVRVWVLYKTASWCLYPVSTKLCASYRFRKTRQNSRSGVPQLRC